MISSVTVARPSIAVRDQGRVPALWLEPGQVRRGHLRALTGDLEQPVLVHLPIDAGRQVEALPGPQPLDVFQHVP